MEKLIFAMLVVLSFQVFGQDSLKVGWQKNNSFESVKQEEIDAMTIRSMSDLPTTLKFEQQKDTIMHYCIDFSIFSITNTSFYPFDVLSFNKNSKALGYIQTHKGAMWFMGMRQRISSVANDIRSGEFNYGAESNGELTANIINMIWLDSATPYNPDYSILVQQKGENCILRVLVAMPHHDWHY